MTGDPSMTTRMWKAFTGDRYISDVPFSRITHYGSSIGRLCGMVSPIRTVQAAEITDEPPQSENPSQNRPAVYISHDEVNRIIQRETGMDRLKDFFTRRDNDEYHPDLNFAFNMAEIMGIMSIVPAFIYGGRAGRETYIRKHQHTKYKTKFIYHRRVNDAIFMGAFKTGIPYSLKIGGFTLLFWMVTNAVANYRNKSSILEYSIGAGIAGSVFRVHLGPRAMAAGGIIGSGLGLVCGICLYLALKSSGETQEERHFFRIQERLRRHRELEGLFGVLIPDKEEQNPQTDIIPQSS